jgi:uncharacterized protein YuzE
MKTAYDQDADALYIALLDEEEPVSRTEQLDAGTLIDIDRYGQVVGIEVIRPARPWPLDEVFRRFEVGEHDQRALRAMFAPEGEDKRYPFAKPVVAA